MASNPWELAQERAGLLRWSTFVQAGMVMKLLSHPAGLRRAARLLRAAGVTKVYLDLFRGLMTSEPVLASARDFLRAQGFLVSAGITTVAGRGQGTPSTHGGPWLCYSARNTRELLAQVMRRGGRLFDEIIVDDFLATMCRCPACTRGRGGRSWGEFYSDQLVEVARRCLLEPAREENPKVRVIIKYPQWYDRFHCFGYDVRRHPAQFDQVWAGTETRDPEVEYVHQYQAFNNYRWLAEVAGEKMAGAWFDQLNTSPEVYVEQAYQSVLAGAPEIILFSYDERQFGPANPQLRLLRQHLPRLYRLAELVRGRRRLGIPAYKPPDSEGGDEAYLYDYLGMFGLPVLPTPHFPTGPAAIFPRQAAADPALAAGLRSFLEGGGMALLTAGALEALAADWRLLAELGYGEHPTTPLDRWACRFQVGRQRHDGPGWVRFGRRLHPVRGEVVASALAEQETFPILTAADACAGRALVLSARTLEYAPESTRVTIKEPVPLIHLADGVVEELRRQMLAPLGLRLRAPARVGLYLFEGGPIVLENFKEVPAPVELNLDPAAWPPGEWQEVLAGLPVVQEAGTCRLLLERRTCAALMPRREP